MFFSTIFSILDARSFTSPWFWLVLIVFWNITSRNVLGVPNDVISHASRALRRQHIDEPREVLQLLDWLALQIPRWGIGFRSGVILTAGTCCGLTVLALLGFRYQLEMAQALTFLCLPFAVLLVLRVRLARQLEWVLQAVSLGQPVRVGATEALRRIDRYRLQHMIISLVAVIATSFWAAQWIALHPNGL